MSMSKLPINAAHTDLTDEALAEQIGELFERAADRATSQALELLKAARPTCSTHEWIDLLQKGLDQSDARWADANGALARMSPAGRG